MILSKTYKTIRLLSNPIASYQDLHWTCGDIIYDQSYNTNFHQKLELMQYNTYLTIAEAIRSTSNERLHEKLRLESL